jgi:hypothetical protein
LQTLLSYLHFAAFTVGAVSPLNSGWFHAVPSMEIYEQLKEKAVWRLGRDWSEEEGWAEKMPDVSVVIGVDVDVLRINLKIDKEARLLFDCL